MSLLLALMAATTPAIAQSWGGSLGYASDNVYRGLSLSSGTPAWLADLHYSLGSDWVVGVSASQERPRFQSSGAQIVAYLDRRWQLDDDWSAKLGLMHYESPWNFWHNELNYNELTAAIGYRGRWRASLALSPDTPGIFAERTRIGFAANAELTYYQPLTSRVSAHVGVGYANLQQVADLTYLYGNAGVSIRLGEVYWHSSMLWTTPDAQRYTFGNNPRTRWVNTLIWHF